MNLDLNRKYEYNCPVSGQPLYYEDNSWMHTYDGPSTYSTEDGKYKYDIWPREYKYIIYKPGSTRNGYFYDNGWREFESANDELIFLDDPFFEDKLRRAKVYSNTRSRLSNIAYDKKIAAGNYTGFRRVTAKLVKFDKITVQPLSAPSNMLFYMDYTVGKKQNWFKKLKNKFRSWYLQQKGYTI